MKTKALYSMLLLLLILGNSILLTAQKDYKIDVSNASTEIIQGHLDLGGSNLNGDVISVNSHYIEKNAVPFIPVIGEFHFSRYPYQYWDEELKKMKAGGITVIATYIFWNLHEFKEGVFDWKEDLNIRHFVELCANNGLDVIVRIGPFDHGEMRNGGLPDWLYGRPIEVRSNDPAYLFYANRLYQEIGKQLKGLMFKDNGPVIGVQIENEYQHSAAPWAFTYQDAPRERTAARFDRNIIQDGVGINNIGNEFQDVGQDHMTTLKELAINAGLIAPIYTATGWGYATIIENGSIPVMAGYAFPFWTPNNQPSPFYLYKDLKHNPDYSPVSYDGKLYPSMAAELGTGMAVTYSRRPRVPGESFLPMMVRTVGSGTNGLGYYMYHGGTTPSIDNFFFSEGSGLANKSYDYQAPIGEYGNVSSGYYSLKLINYFLKNYGNELAPLPTILPKTNDAIAIDNINTLRYAVRSDGNKGFLFMHNYQDHLATSDLEELKIEITTNTGTIRFPETGTFTLKAGSSAIFPFNSIMDGLDIKLATVQPFCRFSNNGKQYNVLVSIDGIIPQIILKGKVKVSGSNIKTTSHEGNTVVSFAADKICEMSANGVSFLVIPYEKSLQAYVTGINGKHLIISNSLVLDKKDTLSFITTNQDGINIAVYPAAEDIESKDGTISEITSPIKSMSKWEIKIPEIRLNMDLIQADDRHYVLKASNIDWKKLNDVFITFDYRGDRGICMMNGMLQTDNLYTSTPWTIGLKRFSQDLKNNNMYFSFVPMRKDAPYLDYLDKNVIPDFSDKKEFLEIKKPVISAERIVNLCLKNR